MSIYGRSHQARTNDAIAHVFAAPVRPLRVVASEAVGGGRGREAFYSTRHDATGEQVTWYAMRWSVEVTFRDSKQHLGVEEPQGWTKPSVERTAPPRDAPPPHRRALVRRRRLPSLAAARLPVVCLEIRTVVRRHARHTPTPFRQDGGFEDGPPGAGCQKTRYAPRKRCRYGRGNCKTRGWVGRRALR